ncbi:MAG: efflux RND transporter periplasmic adaptor subunit [Planctomycetes bacterium]|nr:efflux RND transporter periplasmic adaptor subunit [Planctomycetota bacterium]
MNRSLILFLLPAVLLALLIDGGAAQGSDPTSPRIESLRAEYERLDREAAQAAAEYRKTRGADDGPRSAEQRDKQKSEVRERVAAAFAARQALQRAELNQLRGQFARIERQIESRDRIQDEIIDRRLEELIDPNLQWAPGESPAAGLPSLAETPASSSEVQALQRIQALEAAADAEASPSRKTELYRQAAAAYEEIYRKHRSQVLGLYARLYQARCLEKLCEDTQARAIYSQLGWTPDEARAKLSTPDERAGEAAPPGAPRIVGVLNYGESRVAEIRSRISGRIERLHVGLPGVEVKKGQALVDLYSAELQTAQEEFLAALGFTREQDRRLLVAAFEKLRLLGMTEKHIGELEKSGKPSGDLTLFAPFDGVVTESPARQGQHVQEGTHLLTIADLSRLWARFDVPSSEIRHLRIGQSIDLASEDFPGQTFPGKIISISPQVNLDRTITVIAEVANDHRLLKPGMAVQAVLQPGDGAASEVNLQAQKHVELAQQRLQLLIEQYRAGNARIGEMVAAHTDLLEARLSGAQNAQERSAAIRDHLALLKDLLRVEQAQYKAGQATQTDILAIQAEILKTEQRLAGRAADESALTPAGADAADPRPTRPAPQAYDHETQERLLRLDLDAAMLRVQAAKALLAEAEDARKRSPGAVSEATIRERRVAVELAELEVRRAETLLEAHQESGAERPQLERPDSAAHVKEADLAKLAWDVLGMKFEPIDRQAVETSPFRGGMAILEILTDGPAHKAGLRAGDILVGLHVWETISNDNLAFVLQQEVLREGGAASSGLKAYVLRDGDVLIATLSPDRRRLSSGRPR